MTTDTSAGWDAVADRFIEIRSSVGTALVRAWAKDNLAPSAAIVDIGCGSGVPIARALACDGYAISGIDASPSLIAAFRHTLPDSPAVCEPVQDSAFFGRRFDGAIAIGLIFLLDADDQRTLLAKVAAALEPGGRFLFSAPKEPCAWRDTLTGRTSLSLGEDAYARHLDAVGLHRVRCHVDEGGNHYYDTVRLPDTA